MRTDSISLAMPGKVCVTTRSGWKAILDIDTITHIFPRSEGGTALKLDGVKTLLLDVPFDTVCNVLRKAGAVDASA